MKTSVGVWLLCLAAGIGGGFTGGPDESLPIDITPFNDPASTADIVSILLDGGTATAFPILWDSPGTPSGPDGTNVFFSGVDTQLLTVGFFDGGNGFEPGESVTLAGMDPDGGPGPAGVTIAELAGVRARFDFENGSSWSGVFVDNPTPGAGLVLRAAQPVVPAPDTIVLPALGTGLIGYLRRRRML